jgi:hypothetical protein
MTYRDAGKHWLVTMNGAVLAKCSDELTARMLCEEISCRATLVRALMDEFSARTLPL